jgi:hypothetical protein
VIRAVEALKTYGAPIDLDHTNGETFAEKQVAYQLEIGPARIDILTEIAGVRFLDAWRKRVASTFFGVPLHFISLDDLVANKQALGDSTDLMGVKRNPKSTNSQHE